MNRALFLFVTLSSSVALAAEDLAEQIAKARAEVDELAADVEAERAASREELTALARRKAELEGELDVARRTVAELEALRAAREQARSAGDTAPQQSHAALQEGAARLRRHVEQGLPFRTRERLARIADIEQILQRGSDAEAGTALERFIDDELVLARSTERVRHPVHLGDKQAMADVVRVGLVLMYFKDGAGNVGVVLRDGSGAFAWRPVTDSTGRAQVITLVDSLRRGPTSGAFVLPFPAAQVQP